MAVIKLVVKCTKCGQKRVITKSHSESKENYLKRRPLCAACGYKKRIKTLGGHSPNWKNGKTIDSKGYVLVWSGKKYIKEHHKVWIDNYGKIPKGFVVHHIDENKKNNSPENLKLLEKKEHDKLNNSLLKNHWNKRLRRTENLLCEE